MSDWSQGYPTDNAYSVNIQTEINPWRWRQSMLFANLQPPDPSKPFRFLELGCGSATTLIALAACYPESTFVGYDYMPEHIVIANQLIEETGLTNVTVIEGSFAEMAAAPPAEKFDFAAAHGVWAWVPDPVRGEIVQVLGDWLAPGAVAYFGYNAAAGWAAAEPIRQIFRSAPRGRGDTPFEAARAAVDGWLAMQGAQFRQAQTLWDKLKKAPDSFWRMRSPAPRAPASGRMTSRARSKRPRWALPDRRCWPSTWTRCFSRTTAWPICAPPWNRAGARSRAILCTGAPSATTCSTAARHMCRARAWSARCVASALRPGTRPCSSGRTLRSLASSSAGWTTG